MSSLSLRSFFLAAGLCITTGLTALSAGCSPKETPANPAGAGAASSGSAPTPQQLEEQKAAAIKGAAARAAAGGH